MDRKMVKQLENPTKTNYNSLLKNISINEEKI